MIQDAVIRNFEIIGEATKRLSAEIRAADPDVPWQQVAGFRDVLIHDYLKVNLNRVWGVIEQNLPQLKATVEAILQELREL
ncbi:HepT-like ribonuclease domain-containing protein [Fischerella sp. FACHB-380]|uniref:HepT-like ribonuclease domain-containing protein n=1 Tax=Fischerella sp. FACHB-380 TaxID=2692799 RepID=UPI0030D999D1